MNKKIVLLVLLFQGLQIQANGLDAFKGVWTTVQNFATETLPGIFKSFGASFGGSPTGYVYSFEVYNDMQQPVYFTVGEILSFMGGDLPKPNGITLYTVDSFKSLSVKNQSYYFELLIKSSNKKYSSNMPYLPHDDVLLRHDAIALTSAPHSQKINYYRAFVGKVLKNGQFEHVPDAEYLGYINNNPAESKSDPGDVKIDSKLSSLTLYNSTDTDYDIGFLAQASATSMTQATAQVYTTLPAHSFGLLNTISTSTGDIVTGTFADVSTLTPGTIGLFDKNTRQLILTYNLPTHIFQNMPYTLEIYQDQSKNTLGQSGPLAMNLQGLMSGNYDQPISKVMDITPVVSVFWYQSVAQVKMSGYIDLQGKVWLIGCYQSIKNPIEKKYSIITAADPGDVLQFCIQRPEPGKKLWLYFVYVATKDEKKAQKYCESFIQTNLADSLIDRYHAQAAYQMQLAASDNPATTANVISPSLLEQAAQGILSLSGGQIFDPVLQVAGYLLGADVYYSSGVGAGPMYYVLQPSMQNSQNLATLPTSVVQNMYAASGGQTTAPSGMPEPTLVV